MKSIIENIKHKNSKGLEVLANKYFKEFFISGQQEWLEKAVIAKAFSFARSFDYEGNLDELFEKDIEIILMAKRFFAKSLHNLGFSYVRISELLKVDLFEIVNKVSIRPSKERLPNEIFIDPSALVALGKMCFVDMIDFIAKQHKIRGWLFSRDIRRYAIERSNISFLVFENRSYDPIYFVAGHPVKVFSEKELEFIERANFLVTNDDMLLCLDRCPKERLERFLNKAVLVNPDAWDNLRNILSNTKIITVGELIYIAKNMGFDAKLNDETVIID